MWGEQVGRAMGAPGGHYYQVVALGCCRDMTQQRDTDASPPRGGTWALFTGEDGEGQQPSGQTDPAHTAPEIEGGGDEAPLQDDLRRSYF